MWVQLPACLSIQSTTIIQLSVRAQWYSYEVTFATKLTDEFSGSIWCTIHRQPPSPRPISHDHGLQVHLQTCSITAAKGFPKLAGLWPRSSHHSGLQVYLQTPSIRASRCISRLASLRLASVYHPCLLVVLQTRSIRISECISKLTPSRASSVSRNMLDHGLQVYLQTRSIMASECLSEFSRLSFSDTP
jgi:hypothetical protein